MDQYDISALAFETLIMCLNEADTGSCIVASLTNDTGLSADCADCFSEEMNCLFGNCPVECLSGIEDDSCTTCLDTHCTPLFNTCSGLAL